MYIYITFIIIFVYILFRVRSPPVHCSDFIPPYYSGLVHPSKLLRNSSYKYITQEQFIPSILLGVSSIKYIIQGQTIISTYTTQGQFIQVYYSGLFHLSILLRVISSNTYSGLVHLSILLRVSSSKHITQGNFIQVYYSGLFHQSILLRVISSKCMNQVHLNILLRVSQRAREP